MYVCCLTLSYGIFLHLNIFLPFLYVSRCCYLQGCTPNLPAAADCVFTIDTFGSPAGVLTDGSYRIEFSTLVASDPPSGNGLGLLSGAYLFSAGPLSCARGP